MTTRGSFQRASAHYLEQYLNKIRYCVALLDEDEVWRRPVAGSNSIGNLLLHLAGNLSLWVLDSLGGEHHLRQRSLEFSAERTLDKTELVARLAEVVERCCEVTAGLTENQLAHELSIQGYSTDGRGALFHAVEHMSYHTGQIVYWTKVMTAGRAEIEFYPQHRRE